MKVLLLNPPMNYQPLGLGYLAAVLEKEGIPVKLIDLVNTPFENVESIIQKEKPQIVGISCNLTTLRWGSFKLAQIVKRVDPNIKVVMGGIHATFMYQQVLANLPVDIIVRFEGELTFLELVKALESGSDLKAVKGIAFKSEEGIIKTEDRPPIENLDSLPFPAYHFLKFDMYGQLKVSGIVASRGCPYNCQYCSNRKYWGRLRQRSVKNVVDELEMLYNDYGVRYFSFFDNVFTANKERVIEICQEIIKRKLDVSWECSTKVELVSPEMLQWMKKANCLRIGYGVESGSPSVLKAINKKQTPAQIVKAFKMTQEAGIEAILYLMIGNPNETDQTINETIEIMRLVKPDVMWTGLTLILPGTDMYEICKRRGFIDDEFWLSDKGDSIYTMENNIKQLKNWEWKISYAYYLQRKRMLRLVEMTVFLRIAKNIREAMGVPIPIVDMQIQRFDHILHQTRA